MRTYSQKDWDGLTIYTERSLYTDNLCFAQMLYDDGSMSAIEFQIYTMWFDEYVREFPLHMIIYLDTPVDVCTKRIAKRGRAGEDITTE
jgi:deoxyguanosine kinase